MLEDYMLFTTHAGHATYCSYGCGMLHPTHYTPERDCELDEEGLVDLTQEEDAGEEVVVAVGDDLGLRTGTEKTKV